jgi:hypothetical protein
MFLLFFYLFIIVLSFLIKKFSFPISESIFFIETTQTFLKTIFTNWHTPIYFFIIYLFQNIFFFISKITASQLVGVASIWLTTFMLYKANIKESRKIIAYCLGLFFVFYPPIYNSMFLLDIDNTILIPLTFFIFMYIVNNLDKNNDLNIIGLLFLLFWVKEVAFPVVMICLFFIYFLEYGMKKALVKSFKIGLIVSFLSLFTYGIYSFFIFGDWGALGFNGAKLLITSSGSLNAKMMGFINKIFSFLLWCNPLILLIFIFNFINIFKDKKSKYAVIFIVIYVLMYTIVWPSVGGGFPKYYMPIIPLFFYIFSRIIDLQEIKQKKNLFYLFILVLFYFLQGDYLLKFYQNFANRNLNIKFIFLYSIIFILIPLLVSIFLKYFYKYKITYVLIVFFIAQNMGLVMNQITADYSTSYHYGDKGIYEVFNFIKNNKIETKTDFNMYNFMFKLEKENDNYDFFIRRNYWFEYNGQRSYPKEYENIMKNYTKYKQIGSYQVWKVNKEFL